MNNELFNFEDYEADNTIDFVQNDDALYKELIEKKKVYGPLDKKI